MKKIKRVLAVFFFELAASVSVFSTAVFAEGNFSPISMVSFKKNLTYVEGEGCQVWTVERTLEPFSINKYETTYALWYQVRKKAEKLGYVFENPGQPGSDGRRGQKPTEESSYMPVTMITWYDAVVWCNALSELKGKTPCYTYEGQVLRDSSNSSECDLCVCDFKADGYRLPKESEWEYAARRTKSGFADGALVSGSDSDDMDQINSFSWNSANASGSNYVGTAGVVFDVETEGSFVQPGSGNANGAGLFDMSGNVLEFCWDWFAVYDSQMPEGPNFGYDRVSRGGSWSAYTPFLYSADRYHYDPNECYNFMGFRICCSIK